MNEPTNEQIRHALENAERRAYEAGEPFTDEDAHALVARLVARAERRGRQRQTLPVDDLLVGMAEADGYPE